MRSIYRYVILITVSLVLTCSHEVSGQSKYKVSEISKELLTDSKAVVRYSDTEFEIMSISKAVLRVRYVITILNKNGIDNSRLICSYGKFQSVRKIDWELYDQNGNAIRNNSNIRIEDYSAIAGYSLYEDNRVKFVDPKYRTTPFTVAYSYEIIFDGLLSYPEWKVYDDFNVSVEISKFTVVVPDGFKFRYKEQNISEPCSITSEKEKTSYSWVAMNQPAIKREPFSAPYKTYTAVVYTAPFDFEIDNYKGNCKSWNDFGSWILSLGEGRNILNRESTEKIKNEIDGLTTDYEKIEALYKYMQNKVRYVSVQVGIGGWQATDAESVDRLSYGDCKALANYMKTLLGIAGINSYYTLALAGEDKADLIEDFPSNQFNHAIVCVPLPNDTVWLECTNQHIPAGYIGKFTDDRNVLLIGKEGGFLVRTKAYSISENLESRQGKIELDPDGNAVSTVNTIYKGIFYDDVYRVLTLDNEDKKLFMQSRITAPSYDLISFNHTEKKSIIPSVDEEVILDLHGFGTRLGNKMLFNPNFLTRFDKVPGRTKDRKSIVRIKRPYCESDTIVVKLPAEYLVEQVPENTVIHTKYGEYSTMISLKDREICYIRSFRLFKGDYPAADYNEFVNFCENIHLLDERQVALIKNI
jgi:transglutaminase-like putative cysteine protease